MILAIASTSFPQTFDGHGPDSGRQPKAVAPASVEHADTVDISSQALAAQASYRRVTGNRKAAPVFAFPEAD